MGKIELSQHIAAPPRHVFAFFVPQRMPYWYGAEMGSCFEVQDGAADFALGLKVRISGSLAGHTVSHTAVVTGFEPGRLLEWRFQDAYGVRGLERWTLTDVTADPGDAAPPQTLVSFVSQYELPGRLGRLLDFVWTRRALVRRSSDYLRRLARLVERRPEPAHSGSAAR
jgi:uncharacterized protein YndB with AHSA1/START domain